MTLKQNTSEKKIKYLSWPIAALLPNKLTDDSLIAACCSSQKRYNVPVLPVLEYSGTIFINFSRISLKVKF